MALTQVRNRVYAKISDLSEESVLVSGDKLIFHAVTTGNTSIIDWSNVKIDLEHCTFGEKFNDILNFTSTAQAWVETTTASYSEIEARVNEVTESVTQLNDEVAAIKLLLKMMLGLVNDLDPEKVNKYKNTLPATAIAIYEGIINDVEDAQNSTGKLNFTIANFLQFIKSN